MDVGFIKKHPELLTEGNAMDFLSDDGGATYNRCHCEFNEFLAIIPHAAIF